MTWYRVEFDDRGRVVACDTAEQELYSNGHAVVYIAAESEELARIKAQHRRAYMLLKERRARYRAEGKCRCGRETVPGGLTCEVCRERQRDDNARQYAARRAANGGQRLSPRDAQVARRSEVKQSARLEVLLEVRRVYERFLNTQKGSFVEWLYAEINEAKKVKGVAA